VTIKQITASLKIKLLSGILPIRKELVPQDIFAGLTLAAAGIPQAMGYTKIAGTPVVTGFYTLLLPLVAFALLGGSRRLVVASDSATAAILAASLITLAPVASPEYVGLTSLVAFIVALMLLAARFLQLGFLADFLSRSAIVGFMTGVGVQVACGQLAGLFGLHNISHEPFEQVLSVLQRLPAEGHWLTAGISLVVIVTILSFRRFAPRVPGALLAVIGMIVCSILFNLEGQGVEVVGMIPSGLPSLSLPALQMSHLHQLLMTAATCFVVIIAQSAATSRSYGMRHSERVDENSDLVGLSGANAMAALSGTFVVNGTPTQTELVDGAGGRSQLAHITTALVVALVLLFLTGPLAHMPMAVLSAIVFLVGIKLIDIAGLRDIYRLERGEFVIALATGLTVLLSDIMDGIAIAMLMSLIAHVRHTYVPRTSVMQPDREGRLRQVKVQPNVFAAKGIIVYRFEANMFYANAGRLMDEVIALVESSSKELRYLLLDASPVNDIDYTAAKSLLQLHSELQLRGVGLACVAQSAGVLDEIRRYTRDIRPADGRELLFTSLDAALKSLASQAGGATK